MPMYMDIHDVPGATREDVAKAHVADLHVQDRHGVEYVKYWVNEEKGKIFCLCNAPNAEAADAVHREAHGLMAARIMEVTPEVADAFMGAAETDGGGAVLLQGSTENDPGTRTIMFTDIVGSTTMTQHLGDEVAFALLELHNRIVRAALTATNGREVKHTGDGIMAVFCSAASAVRCGINVQKNISEHRNENLVRLGQVLRSLGHQLVVGVERFLLGGVLVAFSEADLLVAELNEPRGFGSAIPRLGPTHE